MGDLPTGTVTFVFTDIEGSTPMLQRLGDERFLEVLEAHNELMRQAFADGVEIRTEGDAFFYAFTSASDAVVATIRAQLALAAYDWPVGGTVRARIGLHTGQGMLGGDDYTGIDVHRAARVSAAGHGGQILLTGATHASARQQISEASSLMDLGLHHFKGLDEPEHIFQVVVPGLTQDHPPIRSLDARPNNLPAQPSEFVGRAQEVAEVSALLEEARLVTLLGPGGSGKTRLAVQVASQVFGRFEHGVVYVPLDSLREAELVAPAISTTLGLDDDANRPAVDAIAAFLATRPTLLLLDNFEHVLGAAADVATLLERAPELKILVTSQAVLQLRGEHRFDVPPLVSDEAAELFIARAKASDPSFSADAGNEDAIDELVSRLEGMPLALELAAARVRLFGVRGLLERVAERLELGGGLADVPERHRTLAAAIQWSYELLDAADQDAFRRLGIFDGGFTLDAAETVAGPTAISAVASLLDKSLLRSTVTQGETRFSMLDSIRHFSLDKLTEAGDHDVAAAAHAEYFAQLSETARPVLEREGQEVWLDRLTAEHDNMRAVLRRSVDGREPDEGLRTAGAAWRYFHRRGHLPEARDWLTKLLALPGASESARAEGMIGLAGIVYWQGDYEEALRLYPQVVEIYRELGDDERLGDSLIGVASAESFLGEYDRSAEHLAAAHDAFEKAGSADGVRRVFAANAFFAMQAGRLEEAYELWSQAHELFEQAGDTGEQMQIKVVLALVSYKLGRTEEATVRIGAALEGMLEIEDVAGTTMVFEFIGSMLAGVDPERAVRLAGAASRLRAEQGGGLMPASFGLKTPREIANELLTPETLEAAWAEGQAMSFEAAVAYARNVTAENAEGKG